MDRLAKSWKKSWTWTGKKSWKKFWGFFGPDFFPRLVASPRLFASPRLLLFACAFGVFLSSMPFLCGCTYLQLVCLLLFHNRLAYHALHQTVPLPPKKGKAIDYAGTQHKIDYSRLQQPSY
jgi:hypothetical protein